MLARALIAFWALPGVVAGLVPALLVASDGRRSGGGVYGFSHHEEPWLMRQFGDEWVAYSASVRQWLPRLTPWKQDKSRQVWEGERPREP